MSDLAESCLAACLFYFPVCRTQSRICRIGEKQEALLKLDRFVENYCNACSTSTKHRPLWRSHAISVGWSAKRWKSGLPLSF